MRWEELASRLGAAATLSIAALPAATQAADELRQDMDVPAREAVEVLRHGEGMDVPDWAAFARAPALMLDAEGRLYVRAPSDPRVRVLDGNGGFLRYVGRSGNGPGEFTSIAGLGLAGDTLWLKDFPTGRLSFFRLDGMHLKTEPYAPAYPNVARTYGAGDGWTNPLGDGRALYMGSNTGSGGQEQVPLMVGDRTATARRDTLAFVLRPGGMHVRGVGTFWWEPVKRAPIHSLLANGKGVATATWTADAPGEVVLRRYGVEGEVSSEHVLRFPAREISSEARDRLIAEGVEKAKGPWEAQRKRDGRVPGDLRAAVVEGLALPRRYSPVDAMFATQDDRIWLRATAVDGEGGDWFVVGPEGRVEFRVRPPPGVSFKAAGGNRVWGVGKGRLDTPYIALYELSPPS